MNHLSPWKPSRGLHLFEMQFLIKYKWVLNFLGSLSSYLSLRMQRWGCVKNCGMPSFSLSLNTGITLPQSSVAPYEAINYRGLSLAWVQRQVISSLLIVHAWWDAFLTPLFPFLPLTCDFGFRQMSNASLPPPSFVTNFAVCVVLVVQLSPLFLPVVNVEGCHALSNHCCYFKSE